MPLSFKNFEDRGIKDYYYQIIFGYISAVLPNYFLQFNSTPVFILEMQLLKNSY